MLGIPKKSEQQEQGGKIIIEKSANGYTVRRHGGGDSGRADQKVFRDKKQLQEWLDQEIK